MKAVAKLGSAKKKKVGKQVKPEKVGKHTLRSALLSKLKAEGGRKDVCIKSHSKSATRSSGETPLEERAGFPLKLTKGGVHPKNWKSRQGDKIHVDYARRSWLPDEWGQGVKQTQPIWRSKAGGHGGVREMYVAPDGRSFFHKGDAEKYAGREFTKEDGWNGQVRLASVRAKQAAHLARQQGAENLRELRRQGGSAEGEGGKALLGLLTAAERRRMPSKDDLHICIVSARRAKTLEGVQDIFTVETQFQEAGVRPTWYVDEGSLKDYRALGLNAVVGGKLTEARNKGLRDARAKGKVCVQCSDDISSWEYRDGPNAKDKTDDAMNSAHNAARRLIVSPVAAARFIVAKMRACSAPQPKLGGVYMLGSCARTFAGESFARRHFVLGDFFVVEPESVVKFDVSMRLKEDYDFTCSHIAKYGSVMRCNRMTLNVKHYSNGGGACSNRDGKGEEERRNIGILMAKWPGVFRSHPKRMNEVILSWKLAHSAAFADEEEDDGDDEPVGKKRGQARGAAVATAAPGKVKQSILKTKRAHECTRANRLPLAAVLKRGGTQARQTYIVARLAKVEGMTVGDVLARPEAYMKKGKSVKYSVSDLKYDLQRGYVKLVRGARR